MVTDFLWIKKEGGERVLEEIDKQGDDRMRRGEELWREMWRREIELRKESKMLNGLNIQVSYRIFEKVCSTSMSLV
jgi:hypothetical protein